MESLHRPGWSDLTSLAFGLGLPAVTLATAWGHPCLKAHGKLWVWWSPGEYAPVFKVSFEEREVLLEAEPSTFFVTQHYHHHPLILMRPERFDHAWATANLTRVWRAQAPKRFLKAFDAAPHPP